MPYIITFEEILCDDAAHSQKTTPGSKSFVIEADDAGSAIGYAEQFQGLCINEGECLGEIVGLRKVNPDETAGINSLTVYESYLHAGPIETSSTPIPVRVNGTH